MNADLLLIVNELGLNPGIAFDRIDRSVLTRLLREKNPTLSLRHAFYIAKLIQLASHARAN